MPSPESSRASASARSSKMHGCKDCWGMTVIFFVGYVFDSDPSCYKYHRPPQTLSQITGFNFCRCVLATFWPTAQFALLVLDLYIRFMMLGRVGSLFIVIFLSGTAAVKLPSLLDDTTCATPECSCPVCMFKTLSISFKILQDISTLYEVIRSIYI